jgi:ribosome-associated heat shock protein Hsp15
VSEAALSEGGETSCRVDVWLWRARFFKTRSMAAKYVEAGRVHMTRGAVESRLDKPSRIIRPGDGLVFALGGRLIAVRVEGLGDRRGPAPEARGLYSALENSQSFQNSSGAAPLTSGPAD